MTADQSPHRLEIADADGVVRVVLGALDGPDGSGGYGLSVRGPDGQERAALSVDHHGPTLALVHKGNIAIQLGVDEGVLEGDPSGGYIVVADADGTPLLHVSAEPDGELLIRTAATRGAGGSASG